jgi:hypothetical protein
MDQDQASKVRNSRNPLLTESEAHTIYDRVENGQITDNPTYNLKQHQSKWHNPSKEG